MFTTGLVSVTFRPLSPEEIIQLCLECQLEGIEWGGDIHIPHGDLARAKEVGQRTRDSGLQSIAYGSYYRLGSKKNTADFSLILETCLQLQAPCIRVWPGSKGSAQNTEDDWKRATEEAVQIAEVSKAEGISIAYEYHCNTLTDSVTSTRRLLDEAQAPNLKTLWQPAPHYSVEERVSSLEEVLGRLAHLHVYYWIKGGERRPLAEGKEHWLQYLKILQKAGRDFSLLLEFVRDNDPEQLRADAATLREWIAGFAPPA